MAARDPLWCVCAMHPAATDADGHLRFRGFLRLCQLLGPEELVSNLKKLAIGESRHAVALCVCANYKRTVRLVYTNR